MDNTNTNNTSNVDEIEAPKAVNKPKKSYKIKHVPKVNVTGPVALKLGCIEDNFQIQTFVNEVLGNLTLEDYIRFKSRFVTNQKELDDFVEKIKSTELTFNI